VAEVDSLVTPEILSDTSQTYRDTLRAMEAMFSGNPHPSDPIGGAGAGRCASPWTVSILDCDPPRPHVGRPVSKTGSAFGNYICVTHALRKGHVGLGHAGAVGRAHNVNSAGLSSCRATQLRECTTRRE
jgi:hypothetical protein